MKQIGLKAGKSGDGAYLVEELALIARSFKESFSPPSVLSKDY